MDIIEKLHLEADIAVFDCGASQIVRAVHLQVHLQCQPDDRYRWVLFKFGRNDTRFTSRSTVAAAITVGLAENPPVVDVSKLPCHESFMSGLKEVVRKDVQVGSWWTDQPTQVHNYDTYLRASAAFMEDLCSERPLGGPVNRGGLWMVLRGLAARGKRCEISDILYRFHRALLYDLRHGAHRRSDILQHAFDRLPGFHAFSSSQIGLAISLIDPDRPVLTTAVRAMFPTDTHFGALPLECAGLFVKCMSANSLFIQAGWIFAPLRLLRPHVLAARTLLTLRRVCKGWLLQHTLSKKGDFAPEVVALAERGVKRLFNEPIVSEIVPNALDSMYTSSRAVVPSGAVPPPCITAYLEKAVAGEDIGKLPFSARWGVLRALRLIGVSRPVIESAYISEKGMQRWYSAENRKGELQHRRKDLETMFSQKNADSKFTSCATFIGIGMCPYSGDDSDRIRQCFQAHTGIMDRHDADEPRDYRGRPIFSPVQIAGLRRRGQRSRVHVEVEDGDRPASTVQGPRGRHVPRPPESIPFSKLTSF
jgi:hypothetical protein